MIAKVAGNVDVIEILANRDQKIVVKIAEERAIRLQWSEVPIQMISELLS